LQIDRKSRPIRQQHIDLIIVLLIAAPAKRTMRA
jgi:hypothetical protein